MAEKIINNPVTIQNVADGVQSRITEYGLEISSGDKKVRIEMNPAEAGSFYIQYTNDNFNNSINTLINVGDLSSINSNISSISFDTLRSIYTDITISKINNDPTSQSVDQDAIVTEYAFRNYVNSGVKITDLNNDSVTSLSLKDNGAQTVASYTFTRVDVVVYDGANTLILAYQGVAGWNGGSTGSLQQLSVIGTPNINNSVLTGTTGTPGDVTIGVAENNIYVENRLGSPVSVRIFAQRI